MKPTRYKEYVQMNIFDFMGKEADRTLFNLKCIEVDVKGRIIARELSNLQEREIVYL